MSTTTVDSLRTVVVPAPRMRARWKALREHRAFQRAVRAAGPDERSDLLAAARRL